MSVPKSNDPAFDLHGYHPLIIDESVLTSEECQDVLAEETRRKVNREPEFEWQKHLTPEELRDYEAWTERPSYKVSTSNALTEAHELKRTGWLRRYARLKYNGGQRFWYGDGEPPWLRDE